MTRQQVIEIQRALNAQGWTVDGKPLEVDGLWGENTEAALIGFQEEQGLEPDGIPGPLTLAALLPSEQRDFKVGEVPPEYDFATKAGTIEAIKAECTRQGLGLPTQIAYCLATVQHETGNTFKPIPERGSDAYLRRYEDRRDLGNVYPGDGIKYKGRGYVQITGRDNYRKYSKILGIDLIGIPELALEPMNALRILVHGFKTGAFTGAKLETYVRAGKTDFRNARRCINGLDRADLIAGYAREWLRKL